MIRNKAELGFYYVIVIPTKKTFIPLIHLYFMSHFLEVVL